MQSSHLRFGVLREGRDLEAWQRECVRKVLALGATELVFELDAGRAVAGERTHELDFVLNFALDPATSALRDRARFGVWRYWLGDVRVSSSAEVGFWEVYDGRPESGARLVRETATDDIVVLREGHIRTDLRSPERNRQQLAARFTGWAAQLCIDIRNGVLTRLEGPIVTAGAPPRPPPTGWQRRWCQVRILGRSAREGYRALFRHTQWNVGIVDQPIATFLTPRARQPARWLRAPARADFRADPFGIVRDGELTIFCEHFPYATNRGIITAIRAAANVGQRTVAYPAAKVRGLAAHATDDAAPIAVTVGPRPPVHLSYPYLVEADGRTFCLPEAHAAGELVLYELERFPDAWRPVATLLPDNRVVDATPFQHEGRWWIAGSEPGVKGASCELNLWHAPALTGPWQAHPGNPVKIDIRSARPAGTPFRHAGALYRPAQDCSRSYGGRILINRVKTLTPTDFEEELAAVVDPNPADSFPAGIHTLSEVGGLTLIDGKRDLFIPGEFLRVAAHFLRAGLRKLRGVSPTPDADAGRGAD